MFYIRFNFFAASVNIFRVHVYFNFVSTINNFDYILFATAWKKMLHSSPDMTIISSWSKNSLFVWFLTIMHFVVYSLHAHISWLLCHIFFLSSIWWWWWLMYVLSSCSRTLLWFISCYIGNRCTFKTTISLNTHFLSILNKIVWFFSNI